MSIEEINNIIDNLYNEIIDRDIEESYLIDYKGNEYTTDVGYALDGIEFFIKELKQKLK